jgi:hypothetical protein
MSRRRVLYILAAYPQISQTYIRAEMNALAHDHDIKVIARRGPNLPFEDHFPYEVVQDADAIRAVVDGFKPDVIHTHYMQMLQRIGPIAEATNTPFTVRTHSFDVLLPRVREPGAGNVVRSLARSRLLARHVPSNRRRAVGYLNHELCLGVLAFPYVRSLLERYGAAQEKIVDCWPVVDYDAFHDEGPNGDAIMNVGAALPKKKMEDFIRLGALLHHRTTNLYAMGYQVAGLEEKNRAAGSPIAIHPPVQPKDMPAEYKKHQWLVYTADFDLATVGWPMAVAEAQASGVGVCMPNIRADVRQYVGEAGCLYDSIEQAAEIVSEPVPENIRRAGFEHAKRSDIKRHIHLLTAMWSGV